MVQLVFAGISSHGCKCSWEGFAPQFRIGEHASYGATGLGEFKMQQRKAGIRRYQPDSLVAEGKAKRELRSYSVQLPYRMTCNPSPVSVARESVG